MVAGEMPLHFIGRDALVTNSPVVPIELANLGYTDKLRVSALVAAAVCTILGYPMTLPMMSAPMPVRHDQSA